VPFGDFFGFGLSKVTAFESALFSSPEGRSFNSYVTMPFKKAAKIVITNESTEEVSLLFFDIDFVKLAQPREGMLYFHAYWSRLKDGVLGRDFELLPRIEGMGRFLGVNIGVNVDKRYGDAWFGEGEVKMYIDGDNALPTINGTGLEDYIGTGWGLGTFTHRFQGCTIADEKSGAYAFYRFHVPDPIYFRRDLRVTVQRMGGTERDLLRKLRKEGVVIEPVSVANDSGFIRLLEMPVRNDLDDEAFPDGWVNFFRIDDYSATSYFYLDRPVSGLPPLASVGERIH